MVFQESHLAAALVLVDDELGGEGAAKAEELPHGLLLHLHNLPAFPVISQDSPGLQRLHHGELERVSPHIPWTCRPPAVCAELKLVNERPP